MVSANGCLKCAAAIAGFSLSLTGCPLDDRTLHLAPDHTDGAGGSGGGGASGNGGGASDSGGSSGNGGSDADQNGSGPTGSGGTDGSGGSESSGGAVGSGGSEPSGTTSGSGGSESAGGATSSGGGQAGGGGGAGDASSGGTGGALGCSDLDQNAISDCEETLAQNSRFDSDLSDWEAEPTAEVDWLDDTASQDGTGSIEVANIVESTTPDALVLTGAYQCVSVQEGRRYLVYSQMFIPGSQQAVSAAIGALFFDSNNCSGKVILAATSRLNPTQESWRTVSLEATAPEEANSMKLRLAAVKVGTEPPVRVLFDNVLVRED